MMEMHRTAGGWRRIALPASLVLNLFLAALVAGHVVRAEIAGIRGATPVARALASAEASLPAPDAAKFRATLGAEAPRLAAAGQHLAAARAGLERRIIAEPFDKAAVRRALDQWQAQWNQFLDEVGGTLIDALAAVSPEGRRRLVAARQQQAQGPSTP